MSDADVRIGKRLQVLRGELSQAALGEKMAERGHKWSQATVWSVETGKRPLRLAEAADVAAVLRVSVPTLLEADDLDDAIREASTAVQAARVALERFRESATETLNARTSAETAVWQAEEAAALSASPMRAKARLGMLQKDYAAVTGERLASVAGAVEDERAAVHARLEGRSNGVDPEAS